VLWCSNRLSSILLVDDTSEPMLIGIQGVRLLNLEPDDKVAAAVIIPPEELKDDEPTLLQ